MATHGTAAPEIASVEGKVMPQQIMETSPSDLHPTLERLRERDSPKVLKVLLIEDSDDDALLAMRELRQGGFAIEVQQVQTGAEMLASLLQGHWDVIISDYTLPNFNAPEALRVLRQNGADIPFIIVSGTVGETAAVEAMREGAEDFIVKGNWSRLVPAVERGLRAAQERHAQREAESALLKSHDQIQRQLRRLSALRTIDLAITSSYNLALTLEIILDQIAAQLEVDAAAILAFNPKENALHYSSFRGFHKPPANTIAVPANHSCAGKAVENRDLLFISNLKNHDSKCATAQTLFPSEGFVSYCVAPLIAKGKVLGAVEVFHRDTLQPSADWKEFFEVIAGQAAIAMDGAATFDELQRSNSELAFAYDATLRGWVNALDLRDKETEGHTQRVTEMTVRFARTLEVSEDDLIHIQRGALLHDIGKLGIPDQILLKPGPLTEDEWKVMRKHPVYAYQWLSRIPYLRPALEIPYCHHEKWDGTGYPRGLKGEEIPIAARMFALVDVWDALRSDRPYRAGWPAEKVKEHLQSQSGLHFDPRLTQTFINTVN